MLFQWWNTTYLIFQTLCYILKRLSDTEKDVSWKSKGLSTEKPSTLTTSDKTPSPSINGYRDSNSCLSFKGSCLKQKYATFTPPYSKTLFVYKWNTWSQDLNSDFTLKDYLFGGVKLGKNVDPDKYIYSGYDIGSNLYSESSLPDGSVGKNIIFGVDMSSALHIDNKKKDILILHKGPTQEWDNTTLTVEVQNSINFSTSNRKFCLSLHYNGSKSFLFIMLQKYISSKQKILK